MYITGYSFLPRTCPPPPLPALLSQALEEMQAEGLHWWLLQAGQQGQTEVCS